MLRGQKERIKDSEMEIRGLIRDLLVSGESGNLVEKGMTLERLMKDLKLQVKCLCRIMEEAQPYKLSEVTSMSGIQLPRIEVPTFNGNTLTGGSSGSSLIALSTASPS